MRAADFIRMQLGQEPAYGEAFANQPKIAVTLRLPAELVARLDVLKSKGLGKSRNEVAAVMLDAAYDQIINLDFLGDDIEDLVEHVYETLTENGLTDDTHEIRGEDGKRLPAEVEAEIVADLNYQEQNERLLEAQIRRFGGNDK